MGYKRWHAFQLSHYKHTSISTNGKEKELVVCTYSPWANNKWDGKEANASKFPIVTVKNERKKISSIFTTYNTSLYNTKLQLFPYPTILKYTKVKLHSSH